MKTNFPDPHRAALAFTVATLLAAALLPGTAAADPPAIYVSNYRGGNLGDVPAFTASGAPATGYAAPTGYSSAGGVAVDAATNTLYVAGYSGSGSSPIRTFNATTGAETSIGFANAAGVSSPHGLLLAGGDLLVANELGHNILAFDPADGTVDTRFTSPAGLYAPIALAEAGTTLFVSDGIRQLVLAYDVANPTAPTFLFALGATDQPEGLAVYGNELFVANEGRTSQAWTRPRRPADFCRESPTMGKRVLAWEVFRLRSG